MLRALDRTTQGESRGFCEGTGIVWDGLAVTRPKILNRSAIGLPLLCNVGHFRRGLDSLTSNILVTGFRWFEFWCHVNAGEDAEFHALLCCRPWN